MAIHKLSDITCKKAVCAGKAILKLADGAGLYLWVYPNGAKYWRLRYYVSGKERSLSLGVYPDIGLAQARSKLAEARKQLVNGKDPSTERQAAKRQAATSAASTFGTVAHAWFAKHSTAWTPRYARDTLRRIDSDSKALLKCPISELKRANLVNVLEKIEARSTATAHRVTSLWNQIFEYAVAAGLREYNPVPGLAKVLVPHVSVNRAHVGMKILPDLLRAIEGYSGSRTTALALRMLAHVFLRPSELVGATWAEIDLGAAVWEIPAARMKMSRALLVPLSRQVVRMLIELKEISCGSLYVFPGRSGGHLHPDTLLAALRSLGFGGQQSSHGFRHIASTFLNESGWPVDAIERQLAHVSGGVRGVYNKALYLPERVKMLQYYSDFLDGLETGAKVVPFRRTG